MQYTTLPLLISEMSLPVLQQLAPWSVDTDEESGDFFDAGVSNTVVDALEQTAIGELHGYLRGIYPLPLTAPIDPLVLQTVNELVHYQLYKQRDAANLPDKISDLYKAALKRMQLIQQRQIVLDADFAVSGNDEPATFRVISPAAKFPAGFTGETFRNSL